MCAMNKFFKPRGRWLALLFLVIFLFGFSGHLLHSVSSPHPAASVSICAIHSGFLTPEFAAPACNEVQRPVRRLQSVVPIFNLTLKVAHPPTI